MEKVVIIRYCEIHLKGKNRGYFEKVFINNLEKALTGIRHEIHKPSGRYVVEGFDAGMEGEIIGRLRKVFGTLRKIWGSLRKNVVLEAAAKKTARRIPLI